MDDQNPPRRVPSYTELVVTSVVVDGEALAPEEWEDIGLGNVRLLKTFPPGEGNVSIEVHCTRQSTRERL